MSTPTPDHRRFEQAMNNAMEEIDRLVVTRVEIAISPLPARIEKLEERVKLLEAEDRQDAAT